MGLKQMLLAGALSAGVSLFSGCSIEKKLDKLSAEKKIDKELSFMNFSYELYLKEKDKSYLAISSALAFLSDADKSDDLQIHSKLALYNFLLDSMDKAKSELRKQELIESRTGKNYDKYFANANEYMCRAKMYFSFDKKYRAEKMARKYVNHFIYNPKGISNLKNHFIAESYLCFADYERFLKTNRDSVYSDFNVHLCKIVDMNRDAHNYFPDRHETRDMDVVLDKLKEYTGGKIK